MRTSTARAAAFVVCFFVLAARANADELLDRLESLWSSMHAYTVTIEEHETMGAETSDHEILYEFEKPDHARLEVVTGTKAGSVILWDGGDGVTAFRKNLSFFKKHGGVRDHDLTSLRGNSVVSPDLGDILACFSEHRSALRDRPGPVIDGEPTDELELPYSNVSCPDDSASDHSITLDVLDVSKRTGLIMMRRRYEGDSVVERWELKDYKIDGSGSGSSDVGELK